jgi:Protein of unknown function (DUF3592)
MTVSTRDISSATQTPTGRVRLGCAAVALVLAAGPLAWAWYGNASWRGWSARLSGHWQRTSGVILRVEHYGKTSYSPVVQYHVGLKTFEIEGNGGGTGFHNPGTIVDVLYRREDPTVARLTEAGDSVPPIVLAALGLLMLFFAGLALFGGR